METESQKTIEERFASIEKILQRLEHPDVSLDESFELYKQGMAELQSANASIEQTRKAVMAIGQNGEYAAFDDNEI